jgi:VanZ family protein
MQRVDEVLPDRRGAFGRRVWVWAPVVVWAALIFGLSATPNLRFVPDEGLDLIVRKIGHMGVFGILALLIWRALEATTSLRRTWSWALALTVLYAITDEYHQASVVGRHASPVDVAIDAVGALIAVAAVSLVRARRTRRRASA